MSRRRCCCGSGSNCIPVSDALGGSSIGPLWSIVSGSWAEGGGSLSTSSSNAQIQCTTIPPFSTATGPGYPYNVYVDVYLQVGVDYKIFVGDSTTYLQVTCSTIAGLFATAFSWYSEGVLSSGPYYQPSLPTGFYTLKITIFSGYASVQVGNQGITGSISPAGSPLFGLGTGTPSVACKFRNFFFKYVSSTYGSGLYTNCDTTVIDNCCSAVQLTIPRNLNVSGTGCDCGGWVGTWELTLMTPAQITAFQTWANYPTDPNSFGGLVAQPPYGNPSCFYMLNSGLPCGFQYLIVVLWNVAGGINPAWGATAYFLQNPTTGAAMGWQVFVMMGGRDAYCGEDFTNALLTSDPDYSSITINPIGGIGSIPTPKCDFAGLSTPSDCSLVTLA